jgi:hypothetical protein
MLYFALKFVHVVGAAVLLGTGAGIAFFMLVAHLRGNPVVIAGVARIVVLADFLFTATAVVVQPITGVLLVWSVGLFALGWLDRALDRALSPHRGLLAAGGVDADAHARSRARGRAKRNAAAQYLSSAVLVVVRLRLSGIRGRHRDLLADDRQAGTVVTHGSVVRHRHTG